VAAGGRKPFANKSLEADADGYAPVRQEFPDLIWQFDAKLLMGAPN
jgi:hypothetical protein